jgi:hypothetical protein
MQCRRPRAPEPPHASIRTRGRILFQRLILRRARTSLHSIDGRAVEQHRPFVEQEKREHQDARQQYERLKRNLGVGADNSDCRPASTDFAVGYAGRL